MKLERIALTEFRRFRETLVLDGLDAGLNIFVGANEAGKSTVATAVRAAFLERFKTRTVADFAPWGHAAARPSVELAFRIGGCGYRLHKTFLNRARCELQIDGAARLEGEQAEDKLAALLGFDFPAKGQSRPEHGGIPGLLWIQQGESQHLAGPAGHAGAHLRDALARLSGELASSGGDRLHERVAAERAALFHARTGRPIGIFRDADLALADALQRHAALAIEEAALDADVDRLGLLQRAHADARRDEPWRVFEAGAGQARERLAAIDKDRDAAADIRRRLAAADTTLALLDQQVARDRQDADALQALAGEAAHAAAAAAEATDALVRARTAQHRQAEAVAALARRLDTARAAAERLDLGEQIDREAREGARLDAALAAAAALAAGLPALHAEAHRNAIAAVELAALRKIEQTCADLALRRQAGATRLRFQLAPGGQATLDGAPLAENGELALAAPAVLDVPGAGRFDIAPGGRDLPKLRADADRAETERAALLQRLGAGSLADAEARQRLHERALADIHGVEQRLAIHAPHGIDALRAVRDETAARRQRLDARRAALPAALETVLPSSTTAPASVLAGAAGLPALTSLASLQREAETAAAHAEQAAAAAQGRADQAAAAARVLGERHAAQRRDFDADAQVRERAARATRRLDAREARDALAVQVAAAEAAIAAHRPEQALQNAERFERSADIARREHQARHEQLLQLQGRLEQAGAQGVGEQLAQTAAEVDRLRRRRDQIALRGRALDLLLALLGAQRLAATERLQAPLARRLNHYLALLFERAALRLDEHLMPVALQRDGAEDALDALSFGTQEQLGILVRLAYADLLKEAGRPTLLLLDDALVHADDARRDFMKRALFDAASRHQILLFTCHGAAWRDMGVVQREVG